MAKSLLVDFIRKEFLGQVKNPKIYPKQEKKHTNLANPSLKLT